MTHYTQAYIEEQLAAIQRVRELHVPITRGLYIGHCRVCEIRDEPIKYPCPTIKALDGEL